MAVLFFIFLNQICPKWIKLDQVEISQQSKNVTIKICHICKQNKCQRLGSVREAATSLLQICPKTHLSTDLWLQPSLLGSESEGKREKCNHIGLSPANCTSSNSNEIHKVSALPQKILMNRERHKKVCRIQKLIACTFSPKNDIVKIFLCTIQIILWLFLVHHLLLQTKSVSSQPASNVWGLVIHWTGWNWLELVWQYISMSKNNLCIISIS